MMRGEIPLCLMRIYWTRGTQTLAMLQVCRGSNGWQSRGGQASDHWVSRQR